MTNKFIVFGRPYFEKDEIDEVVKTLKSGWWGTGAKTEIFEKQFAHYVKAKYALAVSSASSGLYLALKTLGLGADDEVITTPLSFVATANAIFHTGARPVFADVDPKTGNIDPAEITKKITKKTKAILPVHLYGRPCPMDEIVKIATRYKLYVIEDAAHAIETRYKNKKIGSIGHITVFSFYATKNLSTGEGGMITTNNKSWIEKMRILSLHGLSRDAYKRYLVKHFSHYRALYPGYKFNMTDIQASLGIHQLKRIEENLTIRSTQWALYDKAFKDVQQIITPLLPDKNTVHARHLYTILLNDKKIKRDKFINMLIKKGVGTGVHFIPIHLQPFYQKTFGYKKGDFRNAEYIGGRTISLPLGPSFSIKQIKYVIKNLISLIPHI